jgi:hypothetical protein
MTRGPVPKRSDERRRRNNSKVDTGPNQVGALGPPCPEWVTGLAGRWYDSLRTSGQAVFYVDSDWAVALIVCKAIMVFEAKASAFMFGQITSAMGSLGATEGDRRRLRIELERVTVDEDEIAAAAAMDAYLLRLEDYRNL